MLATRSSLPEEPRGASAALAAVIVTSGGFDVIRGNVACLCTQSTHQQIELVIVAPVASEVVIEPWVREALAKVTLVEIGPLRSMVVARVEGVRRATAPIVALTEEHVRLDRGWAEALIRAHQGPWAAVGPVIQTARPDRALGWADVVLNHGLALGARESHEVADLPGRNTSYKRSILLAYGPELVRLLEFESLLHADLRARGHRLWLDSAARIWHEPEANVANFWATEYSAGCLFATVRARHWSRARRLVYGLAVPLIPMVRLSRLMPVIRRVDVSGPLLRALPLVLIGLALSALGECMGYLVGAGGTRQALCRLEFHTPPPTGA